MGIIPHYADVAVVAGFMFRLKKILFMRTSHNFSHVGHKPSRCGFLRKENTKRERIIRKREGLTNTLLSYAVAAICAGDDIKTVQGNLGHATASFTLDVYGHVTEEMKRTSADRMEKYIEDVSTL